ncbi:30S ribosomal protein S8 [candidate division WWE3 bacterium RIFCSPHIGHO2_01_FULL_40_23]|uniref:Small ribosomal subunit protein uS8 n=1 Tax=candidate division WWE3 bacterium RIFCSPLOWO2_01_FULL_41_18 TaxID=1802625 RepID=A0A1F4VED3_UNCKA|nr:MAG: 30S ribosomal protein S8 [candidate division WWE3 bacterium RIFCSPHIGHO2_01_FULL_40_23]OGC55300.1 MAG: 30S ribosomal protein S8 [candidate division WWE3 bacterium RIFCSPLOWO2_01_FULL_41_18]
MSKDTISAMLSSIKNSSMAKRKFVELPYTKINERILDVMKEKGFVEGVKVFKKEGSPHKMIHIDLKYEDGVSRISNITRVSKPGRRVYQSKDKIKAVASGFGISIFSTSRGIMDGLEARKRKLGGEVICIVL